MELVDKDFATSPLKTLFVINSQVCIDKFLRDLSINAPEMTALDCLIDGILEHEECVGKEVVKKTDPRMWYDLKKRAMLLAFIGQLVTRRHSARLMGNFSDILKFVRPDPQTDRKSSFKCVKECMILTEAWEMYLTHTVQDPHTRNNADKVERLRNLQTESVELAEGIESVIDVLENNSHSAPAVLSDVKYLEYFASFIRSLKIQEPLICKLNREWREHRNNKDKENKKNVENQDSDSSVDVISDVDEDFVSAMSPIVNDPYRGAAAAVQRKRLLNPLQAVFDNTPASTPGGMVTSTPHLMVPKLKKRRL